MAKTITLMVDDELHGAWKGLCEKEGVSMRGKLMGYIRECIGHGESGSAGVPKPVTNSVSISKSKAESIRLTDGTEIRDGKIYRNGKVAFDSEGTL